MAGDGRLWWSSAAVDTSQLHSPVVHARRRSRRRVAAVVLAALGSVAGVTLLAVRGGGGGEAAAPSELTIRSANLVIRDLAKQWDAQHYGTQPFEFCGQKHLTQAQVKVCAENFLAMLGKEEGTPVRQWGFPELKVGVPNSWLWTLESHPHPPHSTEPRGTLAEQPLTPSSLIQAYSKCMSAQHLWQVRACIGVVTKRLTADNLVTLEVLP